MEFNPSSFDDGADTIVDPVPCLEAYMAPEKTKVRRPWWKPTRRVALGAAVCGVLFLTGSALAVATVSGRSRSAAGDQRVVLTDSVQRQPRSTRWRLHGVTRASQRAQLAFPLAGRIMELEVREGMRVSAGDVLAQLDPTQLQAGVAAASASATGMAAQVGIAHRDRNTARQLGESGAISRNAVGDARAREDVARANLRALRAQARAQRGLLRDSSLQAPFDGTITEVFVHRGEVVGPGQPILRVTGAEGSEVVLQASEVTARGLSLNQEVEIDLPLIPLEGVPGRIVSLADSANEGGLFSVVVAISADVDAGLSAEVMATTSSTTELALPTRALVDPAGESPAVFVVRDGRARRVLVSVVATDGEVAFVRGELVEDEPVVVNGQRFLLDGESVEASSVQDSRREVVGPISRRDARRGELGS